MKFTKLLFGLLFFVLTENAFAQFTIDGQFRSRFVVNHGFAVPVKAGTDAIFSFDQRSRLILNYTNDKYSTRFTLQDARIWGGDDLINKTGVMGNSGAFGVYEAWVDLKIKGN